MSRRLIQNPHQWTVLDGARERAVSSSAKAQLQLLKDDGKGSEQASGKAVPELLMPELSQPAAELFATASHIALATTMIWALTPSTPSKEHLPPECLPASVEHARKWLSERGIDCQLTDDMPLSGKVKQLLCALRTYRAAVRSQIIYNRDLR